MYTLHDASSKAMSKGILEVALKDVSLSSMVGDFYVSQGILNKFEEMKQSIIHDDKLQEVVEKYSENILHSISEGKGTVPDIGNDIKVLLNDHGNALIDILPFSLTKEQEEKMIDVLFENVDFQPFYNQFITFAGEQLPSNAKPMLQGIVWLHGSFGFVTAIGLVLLGIGIVLVKSYKDKRWMLYSAIAFLMSMVLLYGFTFVLNSIASRFTGNIQEIVLILFTCIKETALNTAIFMGSIGAFLALVYFLLHKVFSSQKKIVE